MTIKYQNKVSVDTGVFKSVDYSKSYIRDCILDLKEVGYTYVNSKEKLDLLLENYKEEVIIETYKDNYWLVKKVFDDENKKEVK
jgi:hypothetical protein